MHNNSLDLYLYNKTKQDTTNICHYCSFVTYYTTFIYKQDKQMNFNKIKTICEEKGLTIPALADNIGISEAGLYQSFRNQSMKVDILEKIAKVLDTPIWIFFDLDPEAQLEPLRKEIKYYKDKLEDISAIMPSIKKDMEHMQERLAVTDMLVQSQKQIIENYKKIESNEELLNKSVKVIPKMLDAFDVIKKVMTGKIKIGSPEADKLFDFNPEDYPKPKKKRNDKN